MVQHTCKSSRHKRMPHKRSRGLSSWWSLFLVGDYNLLIPSPVQQANTGTLWNRPVISLSPVHFLTIVFTPFSLNALFSFFFSLIKLSNCEAYFGFLKAASLMKVFSICETYFSSFRSHSLATQIKIGSKN